MFWSEFPLDGLTRELRSFDGPDGAPKALANAKFKGHWIELGSGTDPRQKFNPAGPAYLDISFSETSTRKVYLTDLTGEGAMELSADYPVSFMAWFEQMVANAVPGQVFNLSGIRGEASVPRFTNAFVRMVEPKIVVGGTK